MPFSTRKTALAAAAALGLIALAACGGGGGGVASPGAMPVEGEPTTLRPLTLPKEHSGSSGSFTVAAGKSVDRGGVRFSCAAGGAACAVTVDTESGQARVTGGRLTVARIQAAAPPPSDGGGRWRQSGRRNAAGRRRPARNGRNLCHRFIDLPDDR